MPDSPEVAVARYAAQISLWALGVAGGSLVVTNGLFALEVRRWFDEGVKLSMSVIVDAKISAGGQQDSNTYLAITATNRGSAPTTITHMVLFNYPSWWADHLPQFLTRRFKSHRVQTFIVNTANSPTPIPHVLEPGRNWYGMAVHTPDLVKMIEAGRLDVGVIGSHSDTPVFKRVRRWKAPTDSTNA